MSAWRVTETFKLNVYGIYRDTVLLSDDVSNPGAVPLFLVVANSKLYASDGNHVWTVGSIALPESQIGKLQMPTVHGSVYMLLSLAGL